MASTIQAKTDAAGDGVSALVEKHRAEIDRVKLMDSKDQMETFRLLGVDPAAIMAHYKTLVDQADLLNEADKHATQHKRQLGLASLAAGTAGAYFGMRKLTESKIVKFFAVPIAAAGSYLAGTFVGSRLFAGGIREKSRLNDIDAKNAFERELAVALENREVQTVENKTQTSAGPSAAPVPETPSTQAPQPEKTFTAAIPQRETSFAAQNTANAASPGPQRSL